MCEISHRSPNRDFNLPQTAQINFLKKFEIETIFTFSLHLTYTIPNHNTYTTERIKSLTLEDYLDLPLRMRLSIKRVKILNLPSAGQIELSFP